jgi:hypothetical protein
MALASTSLTPDTWVLIGSAVTSITFQCQSFTPVVISIGTTSTSPSITDPGFVYNAWEGEKKKNVTELSYNPGSTAYIWAKALTSISKIVYEAP